MVTTDGKVGIGTSTPAVKLSVGGNMEVGEFINHKNDSDTFIRYQTDNISINAGGVNMLDLKEDGDNTQVLILSGGGATSVNPANFTDTSFFVSGAIGGKDTFGTSVFGGDVVISGTLHGGSPLKIDGGVEVTGTFELKPKVGDVAIVRNPNGPVKVFANTNLKLGAGSGTIDLLDLDDGAAGAFHLSGSGPGSGSTTWNQQCRNGP